MADSLRNLARDLYKLAEKLISQGMLNRLGLGSIRIIKKRTRQGVEPDGQPFQEYSEGHAKKRRDAGLPTRRVDLKFRQYGASMDALDHVVSPDLTTVEVLFNDPEASRIMSYHNVEGAGKSKVIRRNILHSEAEVDELMQIVEGDVDKLLKLTNFA